MLLSVLFVAILEFIFFFLFYSTDEKNRKTFQCKLSRRWSLFTNYPQSFLIDMQQRQQARCGLSLIAGCIVFYISWHLCLRKDELVIVALIFPQLRIPTITTTSSKNHKNQLPCWRKTSCFCRKELNTCQLYLRILLSFCRCTSDNEIHNVASVPSHAKMLLAHSSQEQQDFSWTTCVPDAVQVRIMFSEKHWSTPECDQDFKRTKCKYRELKHFSII